MVFLKILEFIFKRQMVVGTVMYMVDRMTHNDNNYYIVRSNIVL